MTFSISNRLHLIFSELAEKVGKEMGKKSETLQILNILSVRFSFFFFLKLSFVGEGEEVTLPLRAKKKLRR